MYQIAKIVVFFFVFFSFFSAFGISPKELEKISFIIEKVDNFYKKNPKIKGSFSLNINGEQGNGYFLFQYPSKLKLFFGSEYMDEGEQAKTIVTDGNVLWIYLPWSKVLIEQEIPDYFKDIGDLGIGLSRLLSNYKNAEVSEIIENKEKMILLTLKNPVRNVPFQEITMTINQEGFVTQMKGKSEKDKKPYHVQFDRTVKDKNARMNDRDFRMKPSGDVQILRNVLIKTKG